MAHLNKANKNINANTSIEDVVLDTLGEDVSLEDFVDSPSLEPVAIAA